LIEHFLKSYHALHPSASLSVASDFVQALQRIELPGNARQVENLVRQALVNKNDDSPLSLSDLPVEVWHELSEQGESLLLPPVQEERKDQHFSPPQTRPRDLPSLVVNLLDANDWNLGRSLQCCERLFLEAALHLAQGKQSQTARLLGITSRSVYNKVRKHNLHL
jgi:DNA-binding NtrC family response regulator